MKIHNNVKRYYPLCGVLLIFLSYPSYSSVAFQFFPLFAWFSLVPFFYYSRETISLKHLYPRLFGLSLLAQFGTYGWMGSFGNTIPYGNVVLLTIFIPTLSVLMATRIVVCEYLARRYPSLRLFIFPAVWLLFDFVQSYGYLAFPWTYWGYSQYPVLPLIQWSSVTGVYGITFLLIFANTLFTDIIYTYRRGAFFTHLMQKKYLAFFVVVILIFGSGFVRLTLSKKPQGESTLAVSLIQTCISPWENWEMNRFEYLDELISVTNDAISDTRPDLIIWSESATLEPLTHDVRMGMLDSFGRKLVRYARNVQIPLLTAEIGQFLSDDAMEYQYTNSAAVIEPDGSIRQQYSKIHLAPIGEWFPYDRWFPGIRTYLESMGSSSFTPGTEPYLFSIDGYTYGCLICYEGMFPRLNTHYKREGADFLVNITNDGWSDYYSGHMQHYAASVFRAVENGIWYVRVGNTGYTVLLDPYGRERESMPLLQQGFVNGTLDMSVNVDTVYSKVGDIFVIMVLFLLALLLVYGEYTKKRRSHDYTTG